MRAWFAGIVILLLGSLPAFAQGTAAIQGHSYLGGTQAGLSGMKSTNYLQGIIPHATITVYLTGTQTLATIYADASNTPLSNPFTSNAVGSVNPGGWLFYAAINQGYDVCMSGGVAPNTYSQPVCLTDVYPGFSFTGAGISLQTNSTPNASQTLLNFSNTAPAAPSGYTNVLWQNSGGNESAYVAQTSSTAGAQCFLGAGGLVGAFTDSSGIVKQTLCIGNGPESFTVPIGATQLQLGINDGQEADDTGSFVISISKNGATATQSTVPATTMVWSSTTNPSYAYGQNDGTPPIIAATGLANGDTVTITYLSGTVNIQPGSAPNTDANGWLTTPPGSACKGGPTVNFNCGGFGFLPTYYMNSAYGSGAITGLTGDGAATGPGTVPFTLATVNSAPGTCGDATHVAQVTVNAKGLTTSCTAVPITGSSGVTVQDAGTPLGSATTLNFSTNTSASLAGGVATITATGTGGTLPFVTPEQYGAVGDAKYYFDGSLSSSNAVGQTTGTSTTPATPAVTTNLANDYVVWLFDTQGFSTWTSAPATGTQRLNVLGGAAHYGITINDNLQATPGSVASVTGTAPSSAAWDTATLSLAPKPSSSIGFVGAQGVSNQGTGSVTVNVPAGTANGDFMIGCDEWFNGSNTASFPSAFLAGASLIFNYTGNTGAVFVCYSRIASSEPASYTWTQTNTGGFTASITVYRNVAGLDGSELTSTSAPFAAGSVGKPICIASAITGGGQGCGIITSYVSTTQVYTSINGTAGTGLQYVFGTDDTSAFQSMLSACSPGGCQVELSDKAYALTDTLTIPQTVAINIKGQGPGAPNVPNDYAFGTIRNSNTGSRLVFLTKSLSKGAIYAEGDTHTSGNAKLGLYDFAVLCGAGIARDGCGSDAVDVWDWIGFDSANLWTFNSAGNGFNGSINDSYTIDVYYLRGLHSAWNAKSGVTFANPGGGPNLETLKIDTAEIESNGGAGVNLNIANGKMQGFTLSNSIVQWDNVSAPGPELAIGGNIPGCLVIGNYFEGTNLSSQSNSAWTATDHWCNFQSNYTQWVGTGTPAYPYASSLYTWQVPIASSDPTPSANGQQWYNSTSNTFKGEVAGGVQTFATTAVAPNVTTCGTTTTCANSAVTNPHIVQGTVTLASGTATVTGMTAWTSTSSLSCIANDTTAANYASAVPASTTSIMVTGTGSDVVSYQCVGN